MGILTGDKNIDKRIGNGLQNGFRVNCQSGR